MIKKIMRTFAIVLIAVCAFSLTACLEIGPENQNSGKAPVVDYLDYLEYLWDEVLSENDKESLYDGTFSLFAVEYPRTGLKNSGVDYLNYLEYLWDEVLSEDDKENLYDDTFSVFALEYPRSSMNNSGIGEGSNGTLGVQYAANLAVQSSVDIRATVSSGFNSYTQAGSGVIYKLSAAQDESGDLYNGNGFIITNYHVISAAFSSGVLTVANSVSVYFYGMPGIGVPARVLGGSPDHDIAILELVGTQSFTAGGSTQTVRRFINSILARPVNIPKNKVPAVGSSVIAVGNPLAMNMSVTDGIISVQSEEIEMNRLDAAKNNFNEYLTQTFRVMRTSAAINPGNSGGGLYNAGGELIGIAQARLFWADDDAEMPADNIAFAIPLDIVLRVADQIIARAGEYVAATYLTSAQTVLLQKYEYLFRVNGRDTRLEYTDGEVVISETVYVTRSGNGLSLNTVISTVTIDGKVYEITRVFQIDELMVEAYLAQSVQFNA